MRPTRTRPRRPETLVPLLASVVAVALLASLVPRAFALFTDAPPLPDNDLVTDLLEPPGSLTATCAASITLDWTASPDTYAAGYRVLRATTSGGPYTQIAEVTPRTTVTYVDSPAAGIYYYVVRSFFQNWESADSTEVSAISPTCGSLSVEPVADAMINLRQPTTNYGAQRRLQVANATNQRRKRSVLQFDVSAIPPGAVVTSATVTLCAFQVPGARTHALYRATSAWVEGTVTWNTQPAVVGAPTSSVAVGAVGCYAWPVTADVQLWVDGAAINNGWRLMDTNEVSTPRVQINYRSREFGTAADRPRLDVTFVAP